MMNLARASHRLIATTAATLMIILTSCATAQPDTPREPSFTTAQLRGDLVAWQDWLRSTHPDLAHSTDIAELDRQVEALSDGLDGDYSAQEAWLALSTLNPAFADAHTGLALPSIPDASFPPIVIRDGHAWIDSRIASQSQLPAGDQLVSVDGIDIDAMIANLLPRIRGESDQLRGRILELRFADALALWSGQSRFDQIALQAQDGRRTRLTYAAETDQAGEEDALFSLDFRGSTAILTVQSFDLARYDAFNDFIAGAFASIAARGSERLIVDIRENGGGARELSDRLLAYLTTVHYTPTSAITARITPDNIARIPGAELGQIVQLPFPQWVEPPASQPDRFAGEVYVLIGPNTYSQGIVFATIVQDFNIGRIAGLPTEGAANQTAQVQRFNLPNTGFEARSPLYLFRRASGDASSAPVQPDIPLSQGATDQLSVLLEQLGER